MTVRGKTVLAFGTFDLVHLGHVAYLRAARARGTRLVVVVARDQSVVATKGHAPHFSERERARLVRELSCVDAVLLGGLRDHLSVIKRVRPDVIALGYDHAVDEDALRKDLRRLSVTPIPKIVRIRSHRPDRYASRFVCNSSSVKKRNR